MKNDPSTLAAIAEKEEADSKAAKSSPDGQQMPKRYRLYDKIKDNVSLRTVDTIIIATSVLIIIALIYGIATGTPPQ